MTERRPPRMILRLMLLFILMALLPLLLSSGTLITMLAGVMGRSAGELGEVARGHFIKATKESQRGAKEELERLSGEMTGIGHEALQSSSKAQMKSSERVVHRTTKTIVTEGQRVVHGLAEKQVTEFQKVLSRTTADLRDAGKIAIGRTAKSTVDEGTNLFDRSAKELIPESRDAVTAEVERTFQERSMRLAGTFSAPIGESLRAVELIAALPPVVNLSPDPSRFALQALVREHRGISWVALLDVYAEEIIRVPASEGRSRDWTETQEYRQAAIGRRYLSPLSTASRPPALGAVLSVPVKRETGEITGVLIAGLNLDAAAQAFKQAATGFHGYAYVASGDEEVKLHSQPRGEPTVSMSERYLIRRVLLNRPTGLSFIGEGMNRRVAVAVSVPNPGFPEFGFVVVTTDTEQAALAGVRQLEESLQRKIAVVRQNLNADAETFLADAVDKVAFRETELVDLAHRRVDDLSKKLTVTATKEVQTDSEAAKDAGIRDMGRNTRVQIAAAKDEISREADQSKETALAQMESKGREHARATETRVRHDIVETGDKAVTAVRWRSIGMSLLFMGLAVVIAVITARGVVRPIDKLVAGTLAVARGDYGHRVQTHAPDAELQTLAEAFNNMSEAVQKSRTELVQAYSDLQQSQQRLALELEEAADYVRSLLPPVTAPVENRVRPDWRFVPSAELGGDAFGYYWLDHDHFVIYLLDVCGHGVGAALLSSSVINVLRSQTLPNTDFRDPASVLFRLNEAFQMQDQNNMYFTIWYGVYQASRHRLVYSSGGHPPAVVIARDSRGQPETHLLRTPNMIVGGMPGVHYTRAECTISSPSMLYVFSDGAYEINRPDGSMMSLEEFVAHLSSLSQIGAGRLERIREFVMKERGSGALEDDFSIIEVSVGASEGEAS